MRGRGRDGRLGLHGKQTTRQDEAHVLGRLGDASACLWRTHSLNEGLAAMLDATMELLGADSGIVQLYDAAEGTLKVAVERGFAPDFLDAFMVVPAGVKSASGRALRKGSAVVIEDIELDEDFAPYREAVRRAGFSAIVAAPVIAREGAPLGIISTQFREPHCPSKADLRRLDLYRGRLADFIERMRTEQSLRDAVSAMEAATRAKSRFVAAVGHDLRQPLQVIRLMQAMLTERCSEDAHALEIMEMLRAATDDIAGLAETLLDVHQVESEVIQPEIAEFEILPLLDRTYKEFVSIAVEKGIDLRFVPSAARVRSDPRLLGRILGNFLSNAIKYSNVGKVLVGCRRRGKDLRIEVWDTGSGIPTDELERIFEEFHRVEGSGQQGQGLGYGLFIVKRFADALGHRLEVRSQPGKGSVFALDVPAVFDEPRQAPDTLAEAGTGSPSILVIEDHSRQLKALTLLLEAKGYRVTGVSSGKDAIAKLGAPNWFRPDAVISDYNLPGGLNGIQAIAGIEAQMGRSLPALLITGAKTAAAIRDLDRAGHKVMFKPVDPPQLIEAVKALF